MTQEIHPPVGRPLVRLYDLRGIQIASFLGSLFAGAFLLSRNLRALGRSDEARSALIFGFLGLVPVAFLAYTLVVPERFERLLAAAIQGLQVVVIHFAAQRVHGNVLKAHSAEGGTFFSRWRAAGLSLVLLPVPLAVIVGIGIAFPELPALQE